MKSRKLRPQNLGASVWLDGTVPDNHVGDQLSSFLHEHDVTGFRFNLLRFEDAISKGECYREVLALASAGLEASEIYLALLREGVLEAANRLEPVFHATGGRDGLVTLPLPAELAHDFDSLVEEARSLWRAVSQKNVMVMVPPTEEGIDAMRHLIAIGVNAGVTCLFSVRRYREASDAYLAGMEERLSRANDVRHVASIAEFALGSLDRLSQSLPHSDADQETAPKNGLAVSTARLAYRAYLHSVHGDRFQQLARAGARAQRLAWFVSDGAGPSAGRSFPDEVIGPATVCELPSETIRKLKNRSISGTGIRNALSDARTNLDSHRESYPALEDRLAREMEALINEHVLHTDRAIERINDLCA